MSYYRNNGIYSSDPDVSYYAYQLQAAREAQRAREAVEREDRQWQQEEAQRQYDSYWNPDPAFVGGPPLMTPLPPIMPVHAPSYPLY